MKYLYSALFLMAAAVVVPANDLVVSKEARKKNPTLKIRAWKGDKTLLARVKQDLIFSDWFTLTEAKAADYFLDGNGNVEGDAAAVTLELTGPQGKLQVAAKHTRPDWVVHGAVDKLIKGVFKNPGFCSTQIAFVKTNNNNNKDVWLAQFDGSNATALTDNGTISTEPAWGAGNRYLTYTLYSQTSTDIIILDFEKNRHKRLAGYSGLNAGCALSNKGVFAAMTLSKGGKQVDLFVKDIATDKLYAMTNDSFVEASPCWSPDDRQICYVGSKARRPTLFVVSARGGAPKRLANLLAEAVSPDWSAVSNKICFAVLKGGQYTIAEIDMNKDDREPRILVSAAGDWEAPSWTADGRHLVCSRKLDGEQKLYLVDSWYGKIRELRTGTGVSLPACSHQYVTE